MAQRAFRILLAFATLASAPCLAADLTRSRIPPAQPADAQATRLIQQSKAGDIVGVELSLGSGAQPNAYDSNGQTALGHAADSGRVDIVQVLLAKGAAADLREPKSGRTPLIAAADRGHQAIVDVLLRAGADVSAADNQGLTPLLCAARRGHVEVAAVLLRHEADARARDGKGETALAQAAVLGRADLAGLLLDHGADANARGPRGQTPLIAAAVNGHTAAVQLLLARGADPTLTDESGRTARMYAAEVGSTECLRALARKGTPAAEELVIAARRGHAEAVQALLDERADPNATDHRGEPAVLAAVHSGRTAVVQALLHRGVDLARDDRGKTAIIYAANQGYMDMTQALLEKGAPEALIQAAALGHAGVVKVLLAHGADPNARDGHARIALLATVETPSRETLRRQEDAAVAGARKTDSVPSPVEKQVEIIRLLLDAGAGVDVANTQGDTALMIAAGKNFVPFMEVLLDRGAEVNVADARGRTALLMALQEGCKDLGMIRRHLAETAPEAMRNEVDAAVAKAAADGCSESVQLLLAHGADVHARDVDGLTPLAVAKRKQRHDVAALLARPGARKVVPDESNHARTR